MKGTVHLIHKLDNLWIFKTYTKIGKDLIPMRYTFITGEKSYEDNQEIIGQVVMKEGVEFIREKPYS